MPRDTMPAVCGCLLLTLSGLLVYNVEVSTAAGQCEDVSGKWYNQLGSEIILEVLDDDTLKGEYRTAVERMAGQAGSTHSTIRGATLYPGDGSSSAVFVFSVQFNKGTSTVTHTAQCTVCGGQEVIMTSWLLRSQVDSCDDKWKSTRIGQDTFTRNEQKHGPRKHLDTHTPSDVKNQTNPVRKRSADDNTSGPSNLCSLDGLWYNAMGSEIHLSQAEDGTLTGEYRTAVERIKGAAGSTHSKIYGIGNAHDRDSTLSMMVVWKKGSSVTGWVGQCHVCGENRTEVLEMTWLLRIRVNSCTDNWKSTHYGENSFTRHEQAPGPRKRLDTHTPGEVGEDVETTEKEKSQCTHSLSSSATVVVMGILLALVAIVCALVILYKVYISKMREPVQSRYSAILNSVATTEPYSPSASVYSEDPVT